MPATDPNAARSMLEDLAAWLPQLAHTLDPTRQALASHAGATPTPGVGDPVPRTVLAAHEARERLAPLVDLAFEWARQKQAKIDEAHAIAFLHGNVAWASVRPAFADACRLIAQTHAWVAEQTGNGPETTGFSCPHCLLRGHADGGGDIRLVRHPTDKGYSRVMACPRCAATHTIESLEAAWRAALAAEDLAMPATWIRRHWAIKPATWRKWRQRGRIAPDENGNYRLADIRPLVEP